MLTFLFERANLKVINYSYAFEKDYLVAFVEISSLHDAGEGKIRYSRITINLYDSNENIIAQDCAPVGGGFLGV